MVRSPDTSTPRAVHRLLEHYTPDGTLGRLLLGLTALGVTTGLALGGLLSMLGASLLEVTAGLAAIGLGVGTLLVGLVTLWPVYLSLIGNVESPADYPAVARGSRRETTVGSADATGDAPEAILKRRYAAGELDDEEFERRLSAVLDPERVVGERAVSDRDVDPAGRREREREPLER
jgi:uncharacterized membrane protein